MPLLALVPLMASTGEREPHDPRRYRKLGRPDRRRDRGAGGRGALSAQSVLPPARLDRRARGDDRGRAADRARRRAADADGRHVDGARRVPRRRAARGIDLPPRARSRHRAVPRPPARAVLHGRRHDDRHEDRVGESLAGHRRRDRHHAAQGGHRVGACSASPARSAATRCARARCSPARASSPSCCCRSAPRSES